MTKIKEIRSHWPEKGVAEEVAFSMVLMAGCIKETIKQSLRGKGVNMTEGGETFQVESTSTLG